MTDTPKAHSATSGDDENSSTTGYGAHSSTTGDWAHSSTTGDWAHSSTTGNGAIACALGEGYVRCGPDGAIIGTYHDGKRTRISVGYAGEDGIEPHRWYRAIEGGFEPVPDDETPAEVLS